MNRFCYRLLTRLFVSMFVCLDLQARHNVIMPSLFATGQMYEQANQSCSGNDSPVPAAYVADSSSYGPVMSSAISHNVTTISDCGNVDSYYASGSFVVAVTPNGRYLYACDTQNNQVRVINTVTNAVIAAITVGNRPYGIAITPDGAYAYVANFSDSTISAIDTSTNLVIATTAPLLSGVAEGVAATPNGQDVYIGSEFNTIVNEISTASNTVVATIP